MATAILFTLSICLLFCTVFSKPVANNLKSVQSSHNVRNTGFIENAKLVTETVLIPEVNRVRDIKRVQSLDSVRSFDTVRAPSLTDNLSSVRRIKRQVITGHGCANGRIWFMKKCMPFEEYERIVQEEEKE